MGSNKNRTNSYGGNLYIKKKNKILNQPPNFTPQGTRKRTN